MIKNILRVVLLVFLFNCGIPSFDYIDGATLTSLSVDTRFKFRINLESSEYTTGFKLYSRYYIDGNSKKFEDIDINDTSGDSENYLEDLGFTIVTIIDKENPIEIGRLVITEFLVHKTTSYTVEYDSIDLTVLLSTSTSNTVFNLLSNYKNMTEFVHTIGDYSDTNTKFEGFGKAFLDDFKENFVSDSSLLSNIRIEFAIINEGLSSTLEHIESLPIYLSSLNLQV